MNIEEILQQNTAKIARSSQEAEDLRFEWQRAMEEYDHKESGFVMTEKARNHDLKTTEIKYYIKNDNELYKDRLNLVLLESTYRKKEVEINALKEELNSAKMMARMWIAEIEGKVTFSKKEEK